MSKELQNRAKVWQSQPQRRTLEYPHDSMADWFIGSCATSGHVDLSGDWLSDLRSGVAECLYAAETTSGPEAAFFREAAEILKAIEAETHQAPM